MSCTLSQILPNQKSTLSPGTSPYQLCHLCLCVIYIRVSQFIHESGTYFFNPSNTMKMNAELGADRKHVMPHPL